VSELCDLIQRLPDGLRRRDFFAGTLADVAVDSASSGSLDLGLREDAGVLS
jgi:hypothetical protein